MNCPRVERLGHEDNALFAQARTFSLEIIDFKRRYRNFLREHRLLKLASCGVCIWLQGEFGSVGILGRNDSEPAVSLSAIPNLQRPQGILYLSLSGTRCDHR